MSCAAFLPAAFSAVSHKQINRCCSHQNDDVASVPVLLQPQELRSHLVSHVIQTILIMHETQSAVICCAAELERI